MREIKFRFWTPDKIMLDDHEGWVENIGINEALSCSKSYGYIAMQFTGLKDRNGVEIFEGDIIRTINHSFVVEWGKLSWQMRRINSDKRSISFNPVSSKVIGNIYQNPELLTTPNRG